MSDKLSESPTTFAHPGWRVVYNLITWVILAITMSSGSGIFVGLFMLGCGLFFDYAKFTAPATKFKERAKIIGCWVAGLLVIINLIAAFGALSVESVNSELVIVVKSFPFFTGMSIPVKWYWLISGVSVLVTVIDWTAEFSEAKSVRGISSPSVVETAASAEG